MKRTLISLTLAASLAAGASFAQMTDTSNYGSDWSTSLGSALFGSDGTTLRTTSEIGTQWNSLSEEDKTMLRRDCMMHMQQANGSTGTEAGTSNTTTTDGAATGTTADATTTDGTTNGTTAGTGMSVTAENMDAICAATKDL